MSKPIRVLSIDGGGIRGIIPGEVLAYLEKQIQEQSGDPEARIAEYFDFMAGTSTGAILVLLLLCPDVHGKPLYSARQALELYETRGKQIFSSSIFQQLATLGGIAEEKYSQEFLEKLLKEYFKETKLSELLRPCLITAYEIEKRYAHFFTQHDAVRDKGYDFLIREVARATSAAPTYFEASRITSMTGETYSLIDGAVFANNPAMCAYSEVCELFKAGDRPVTADQMLLFSLGTGAVLKPYKYKAAKDWGAIGWIKPLIDIMMAGVSDTVEYQMKQLFRSMGKGENYIRIRPDLKTASWELDDASLKNVKALKEDGQYCVGKNVEVLNKLASDLVRLGKIL